MSISHHLENTTPSHRHNIHLRTFLQITYDVSLINVTAKQAKMCGASAGDVEVIVIVNNSNLYGIYYGNIEHIYVEVINTVSSPICNDIYHHIINILTGRKQGNSPKMSLIYFILQLILRKCIYFESSY